MQNFSKVAIVLAVLSMAVMLVSGVALERLASTRRYEMRRSSVEALELLALAVAPAVARGRHERAQGVLDNVANFPERFPDVQSLEVLDSGGRVVADLDPQRYNLIATGDGVKEDLARTAPTTRTLDNDALMVVVPLRVTHPLGALRARLSEARLVQSLRQQQLFASLLLLAVVLLVMLALTLVHRLERQAVTDPLTRLPNRRYFNEQAQRAAQRARRYRRDLSLVMLDLDHFKAINDKFRHGAGDRVLQAVANALRENARKADLVARWGGEEMVVLMPETDLSAAAQAAERMRLALKSARYSDELVGHPVTASFGVASLTDPGAEDEIELSVNRMLSAADGAMYAAKDAGRDRVCVVTERGIQAFAESAEGEVVSSGASGEHEER